jgi:AcrR family transcriptional regulator
MSPVTDEPQRRRRGVELESAILDAAWEELVAVGFAKLTMESVAARARTGVAVLYRRWSSKDELVVAAIRSYSEQHQTDIPDTGTLRGDLVALLRNFNENKIWFTAVMASVFSGLLAGSGLTPADIRARVLEDRPLRSNEIFRRAEQRGEIDLARVPVGVLSLPYDLIRHDVLISLKSVPEERIMSIVDDIFMPLVARWLGT